MVKSMFAAVAGLRAHQQKMDVIGNNIANVNTYGFKKARATFTDQFYSTLTGASDPDGVRGGGNPSQIGYGSAVGSIDVNFGTGSGAPTDRAEDVMISGNGFFMVGPMNEFGYATTNRTQAAGAGNTNTIRDNLEGLSFTRVGNFSFDGKGNLVDANRNAVYGYVNYNYGKPGEDPVYGVPATTTDCPGLPADRKGGDTLIEPIRRPLVRMTKDGNPYKDADGKYDILFNNATNAAVTTGLNPGEFYAPMKVTGISIGADGTITGKFDKQPVTIGKIALADVPNPNALLASGNSYYEARGNTGIISAVSPGSGGTGDLEGSKVEMSNVDLSQEMTDMITTQRGFQANTRIITVTDEMLQEMINMKR